MVPVGGDSVALCREMQVCLVTNKGRSGVLRQMGLLSMHDVLGAENFALVERNIKLDRKMWDNVDIRMSFCQFRD